MSPGDMSCGDMRSHQVTWSPGDIPCHHMTWSPGDMRCHLVTSTRGDQEFMPLSCGLIHGG